MLVDIIMTKLDVDLAIDKDGDTYYVVHGDIEVYSSISFEFAFTFWQGYTMAVQNCQEED